MKRDLGTISESEKLVDRLKNVFSGENRERQRLGPRSPPIRNGRSPDQAERTVFIKAPPTLDYGSVAHVVDAVKLAGAFPISLQLDGIAAAD
jgi:biopolymer transport protein ExbD